MAPLLPQLYLASASPRRKQLLEAIGFTFQVISAPVDEQHPSHRTLREGVIGNARLKALAAATRIEDPNGIIIAADTLVVFQEQVLGKPVDLQEAQGMLQMLSGNTHEVMTGVHLRRLSGEIQEFAVASKVTFRCLSQKEISDYIQTREPYDKAGSYAVQGLGSLFIESIEGSYSNIMGFPIEEFLKVLPRMSGIPIHQWFT